ncbi:hypothetical protein E4U35_003954 [Claviceps purpurea]|nr:hypothetical protein E4U51_002748 [Claviceps purpurea]KAG6211001.1 hypothetical protein E4U35_003954 [Claviceps purpurea]
MAASRPLGRLVTLVWGDWQTNALWQRILKYCIAATAAVIIAILPRFKLYASFLTPMVVTFAHPGQRMGIMVESLLMIVFGFFLGLSWSLLGMYLSSLVEEASPTAAYTIRAFFLLGCVVLHGYVRSSSPRLFNLVLFLLFGALLTIQTPNVARTSLYLTLFVPVLMGGGVIVVVNLAIFPELSSTYLGTSTICTLSATMDTLSRATHWFITPGGDPEGHLTQVGSLSNPLRLTASRKSVRGVSGIREKLKRRVRRFFKGLTNPFRATGPSPALSNFRNTPIHLSTLVQLAGQKSKLRTQLSSCKKAQDEVDFEVSVSPLAPATMSEISVHHMTALVQNIVTLIGACENKYLFLNDEQLPDTDDEAAPIPSSHNEAHYGHGNFAQDFMGGSELLLEKILQRIRVPVQEFQASMNEAVNVLICCLAYCFDVAKLPSGAPTPEGIHLAELDLHIDHFTASIADLHRRNAEELKIAVMGAAGEAVDFMPRRETFLVSSFLLSFQASADQVLQMLRHARKLVEKRQRRHNRCRIWVPQLRDFRKWLATGGETDATMLPEQHLRVVSSRDQQNDTPLHENDGDAPPMAARDEESAPNRDQREKISDDSARRRRKERGEKRAKDHRHRRHRSKDQASITNRVRAAAADTIKWVKNSNDFHYALKLAIAVFLVTWPALNTASSAWYFDVKGVWAPMQLIFVFEISIGTSLFGFFVRLFGVGYGCLVGYLSVEIGRGYRVAAVMIILVIGIIPSVYVQLTTKQGRLGVIAIISASVVALAAINSVDSASEIFYKRLVAFLVGGVVAIAVEALILPVRARDRLVESLSVSVRQIQRMQAAVAVGIDDPHRTKFRSRKLFDRFSHCRDKAQAALGAAQTILPFCLTEPRLKGSFRPLAPTYKQIIYTLQQIADQMDNMIQLRRAYGSSVLEDLNPQVHTFRRNVAASITLILFSVNEALTTWLPLPQFLPSARLAELRLINRIRDILTAQSSTGFRTKDDGTKLKLEYPGGKPLFVTEETADRITQQKFLSWNATTAGQMEIIEYLEELVDLVKLLVGVEAFQSGMLERPQYRQYIRQLETEQEEDLNRVNSAQRQCSRRERQEDDEEGVSIEGMPLDEYTESGSNRLRREATATQFPTAEGQVDDDDDDAGSEEDDDGLRYTQMLQRVGTRLRQTDSLARRRAVSTEYGKEAAYG